MSDPAQLAKAAREQLSSALNAIQEGGDDVPAELMDIADPIAEAMGILHRIQKAEGSDLSGREQALASVRGALDALQQIESSHAAIETVMEHVAMALTKLSALSRAKAVVAEQPKVEPKPEPKAEAKPEPKAEAKPEPKAEAKPEASKVAATKTEVMPAAKLEAKPEPKVEAKPEPKAEAKPEPKAAAKTPTPTKAAPEEEKASLAIELTTKPSVQPAAKPEAAAKPAVGLHGTQAIPRDAAPKSPGNEASPSTKPVPAQPTLPAGSRVYDVELGTQSESNFYKGLGGNDVIEHGGIFVATYKIPKLGTSVSLRVHLPGDLQFEATGTVQWLREATGAQDEQPGFGARLTHVAAEGRQLVYRYARNREPIFYDDM